MTSITSLRAYFYKEGLVRFTAERYDPNNTCPGKEQKFLTNTSINKRFSKITNLTWTFEKLKNWFITHGYDGERIYESIKEVIVNTLLAVKYKFLKHYQISLEGYDFSRCYQLLGVDVILNSALEPNVIEVSYKRCTYICTYVYTYTWVCMHACVYVCMYMLLHYGLSRNFYQ